MFIGQFYDCRAFGDLLAEFHHGWSDGAMASCRLGLDYSLTGTAGIAAGMLMMPTVVACWLMPLLVADTGFAAWLYYRHARGGWLADS